MADKVKVWFDAEADFLEVRFSDAPGYEKESSHHAVMERVDAEGNVIGFSTLGVSQHRKSTPPSRGTTHSQRRRWIPS